MKEAKKAAEEASASRSTIMLRAWTEREKASGESRRVLDELKGWLLEHSAALNMRALKCNGLSPEGRSLVSNANMNCIESDETQLAAQLLSGKSLAAIIFEEQNGIGGRMRKFYSSLNFSRGPNMAGADEDLQSYKEWDHERAAVQILKAAIALHKKNMVAATAASMARFASTVNKVRAETARELLAALTEMQRIAEAEKALAGLGEDELEVLRPKPFPRRFLSSEAISFFMDCVSMKIIGAEELSGLQLEAVSPDEVKAEPAAEAVSWLAQA